MNQPPTREQMQEYVRRWKELGPILERMRDEETRRANTQASIRMFDQRFATPSATCRRASHQAWSNGSATCRSGANVVDLFQEATRFQEFLENAHCRFCFIGGLAVQHWGEPRLTRDIDVSLLVGFGGEECYVLLTSYPPRMAEAREFALARRVLRLTSPGGMYRWRRSPSRKSWYSVVSK